MVSFSAEVKDELAHLWPAAACDRRAELAGLVRAAGTLALGGSGRLAVQVGTEHAAVARKALRLFREEYRLATQVLVERRRRLRKNLVFRVRVPPQEGMTAFLAEAGVLDGAGHLQEGLPPAVQERDCCARAYLRGFFLGAGWVSPPQRGHHLEMVSPGPGPADALGQLLFRFGLPVRVAARRETVVLYFKEAEHVARFLGLVGAHQQLLRYEDVRVLRDVKNRINRELNAEAANLQKALAAAERQVESIRRLEAAGRLASLPPALRELAELRLKHPEATLKELGELCHPPLGKSGANHRMRQLERLAGSGTPQHPAGEQVRPGPGTGR